jgi:hypothetical protein
MHDTPFPKVWRVVRSQEALTAAITHLASTSCWFEVTPEPFDTWRIAVKPEFAGALPALKDWATASEDELLDLAMSAYGTAPEDNGEYFVLDTDRVVSIEPGRGVWVTGQLFVEFPAYNA